MRRLNDAPGHTSCWWHSRDPPTVPDLSSLSAGVLTCIRATLRPTKNSGGAGLVPLSAPPRPGAAGLVPVMET